MAITDQMIDQAFSDLRPKCGGVRNDYFGLLYLQKAFDVPRELAINQVAFGGNDYGVDGFHFDEEKRNLYLHQFKWSDSHAQFKQSFQRLTEAGMERIFAASTQDQNKNQLLVQLKACLMENQSVIERIYIQFVFRGDPAEAERSQVLDKLREDLENKNYLIREFFGRPVTMVIEFRSALGKVGAASHKRVTHTYPINLADTLQSTGPDGEHMHVGFVRLIDLGSMHREMGQRFFERNIRAALPESGAVNRAIAQALKKIVIEGTDDDSVFAFNHNGVTLAAERLEKSDGQFRITEPRLLNGAQTITTLSRFLKDNEDNPALKERKEVLAELRVLCKIITDATQEFITTVTINNNRQNPVEPWNLRANDMIQLELQDKFRDDLAIFYERQENAFFNLSDSELEEAGISESKALELWRLSQTFLVTSGEIDKLSRMRQVFEDDKLYSQLFHRGHLEDDSRKIVLCYKVQFRLRKLMNEIFDKGQNKYGYINRARYLLWALLCQGMLNDPDIVDHTESFGAGLGIEADFTEWVSRVATTRCRFLIDDLVHERAYAEKVAEGNFSFLRTNAAYKRCMEFAYRRWKWVEKKLR